MRLKDKVAIVTGASRGIGKGIAKRYSEEGAKVVLASRNRELNNNLANEMTSKGKEALVVQTDVTDVQSVRNMVDDTVKRFGRVDILVNNAGMGMVQPSEQLSPEDWLKVINTNLNSVFYCSQAAAKQMIQQKEGGKILNIASGFGLVAAPMRAAYCTTKAGCIMLTKALGIEWAKYKINVNALAPGWTRTDMVQRFIDRGIMDEAALQKRTPIGRIAEVEDLLGMAVVLVSDDANFMVGETVSVDGGFAAYGYL